MRASRPSSSDRIPRRGRFLLAAGLLGLSFALTGCGEAEIEVEPTPRAIRWTRISHSLSGDTRAISGIVTAVEDTRLAFEVGGSVDEVNVQLGDVVARDQVLARLDPEPFDLAVRDAEADLSEARARFERARADLDRTETLFEANVKSRQELDRDRAARDSTQSRVEAARARLELAQRDLRRSVLRAPFQGAISVRDVEPAMEVASGQTVFEMDSAESGLRVEVQMPETLIMRVRQGDTVGVTFPSMRQPGQEGDSPSVEARLSEVGTRAGAGNAFPVRADLVDAPKGLRPGMTAEVTFSMPAVETDAIGIEGVLIPFSAVRIGADESFSVFVYDKATSALRVVPIRTGGVRDNDIAVLSGLEEGDIIATAGVSFLREGQVVRLADERLVRLAR